MIHFFSSYSLILDLDIPGCSYGFHLGNVCWPVTESGREKKSLPKHIWVLKVNCFCRYVKVNWQWENTCKTTSQSFNIKKKLLIKWVVVGKFNLQTCPMNPKSGYRRQQEPSNTLRPALSHAAFWQWIDIICFYVYVNPSGIEPTTIRSQMASQPSTSHWHQ
jgi:hypothetical protein